MFLLMPYIRTGLYTPKEHRYPLFINSLIEEKLIAWKRWKYSQLTKDELRCKKLLLIVEQQEVNFMLLKKLN